MTDDGLSILHVSLCLSRLFWSLKMERGWEECDNERPLVFDIKLEIATDNADPDDMDGGGGK